MVAYRNFCCRILFILAIIYSSVHTQSPDSDSQNLAREYHSYGKIDAQSYRHEIIDSIKPNIKGYYAPSNIRWMWAPSTWADKEGPNIFHWNDKRNLLPLIRRAKDPHDHIAFRTLISYLKGYLNDLQSKNIGEEMEKSRTFGDKFTNVIFPLLSISRVDGKIAYYKRIYPFIIRALKKLTKAKNFNEMEASGYFI